MVVYISYWLFVGLFAYWLFSLFVDCFFWIFCWCFLLVFVNWFVGLFVDCSIRLFIDLFVWLFVDWFSGFFVDWVLGWVYRWSKSDNISYNLGNLNFESSTINSSKFAQCFFVWKYAIKVCIQVPDLRNSKKLLNCVDLVKPLFLSSYSS